ncbi:hypothetical protein [Rhizobium subbaraonis]|nr:hypothetical protein [Rhizobium subbaraonis]
MAFFVLARRFPPWGKVNARLTPYLRAMDLSLQSCDKHRICADSVHDRAAGRRKDDMMSEDVRHDGEVCNETLALLIEGGSGDVLTDLLVSALQDAFRILVDEMPTDAYH